MASPIFGVLPLLADRASGHTVNPCPIMVQILSPLFLWLPCVWQSFCCLQLSSDIGKMYFKYLAVITRPGEESSIAAAIGVFTLCIHGETASCMGPNGVVSNVCTFYGVGAGVWLMADKWSGWTPRGRADEAGNGNVIAAMQTGLPYAGRPKTLLTLTLIAAKLATYNTGVMRRSKLSKAYFSTKTVRGGLSFCARFGESQLRACAAQYWRFLEDFYLSLYFFGASTAVCLLCRCRAAAIVMTSFAFSSSQYTVWYCVKHFGL